MISELVLGVVLSLLAVTTILLILIGTVSVFAYRRITNYRLLHIEKIGEETTFHGTLK